MGFIPTDTGEWVNSDFERLARIVKDYDEKLELAWIPPDKRTRDDKKPYVIIDTVTKSPVLYASEMDTPLDILTQLFMADNKHGNVLDRLEAANRAQQAIYMKAKMDMYEELHDKAQFLFNTEKHYINMGRDEDGKLIRMDDSRRRI